MVKKLSKINLLLIFVILTLSFKILFMDSKNNRLYTIELVRQESNTTKIVSNPIISVIITDYGLLKSELHLADSLPKEITLCTSLDFPQFKLIDKKENNILLEIPQSILETTSASDEEIRSFLNKEKEFSGIFLNKQNQLFYTKEFLHTIFSNSKNLKTIFVSNSDLKRILESSNNLGINILTTDVTLDEIINLDKINQQLDKLESIAISNGKAIAVGSNYPITVQALKTWIPKLKTKNIDFVAIEDYYKIAYPVSLTEIKDNK